jgi:hypothetical protein
MNRAPILLVFVILMMSLCAGVQAQSKSTAPKVFMTGENEKAYESMVKDYNNMLLSVCNNDLEKSFGIWTEFLRDLETHVSASGYDLKGAKLWINVFWSKDGMIDHIVYYPKPNAKNLNYSNLIPILESFTTQYQLPVQFNGKFSHYGSANFPIINRALVGNPK